MELSEGKCLICCKEILHSSSIPNSTKIHSVFYAAVVPALTSFNLVSKSGIEDIAIAIPRGAFAHYIRRDSRVRSFSHRTDMF